MKTRFLMFVFVLAVAIPLAAPLRAGRQAAQPAAAEDPPTKKNPLRFTAFNVSMQTGTAGTTQIAIERWSLDAERQGLLDVLAGASIKKPGGQDKLLKALQDIKTRVGFIRTPNSLGWDLKYARENMLPDGVRQIVIATDKRVSGMMAASGSRSLDYPFTIIEMHMKAGEKGWMGEGKMLVATALEIKDGRLQLENYGQEPVRLTQITQEARKKK